MDRWIFTHTCNYTGLPNRDYNLGFSTSLGTELSEPTALTTVWKRENRQVHPLRWILLSSQDASLVLTPSSTHP